MSENEGGESRTTAAFMMGFALACLLCLGAGGAFFWTQNQRMRAVEMEARMQAQEAEKQAQVAEEQALDARRVADAQRAAAEAEKARREAKERKKAGE